MTDYTNYLTDPLFHVNFFVWLTWKNAHAVTPNISSWFIDNGYELIALSPELSLPLPLQTKLKSGGFSFRMKALPDLLLRNIERREIIALECKSDSFGNGSSNVEQATCLIAHAGQVLRDHYAKSDLQLWQTGVRYSVPYLGGHSMFASLASLAHRVNGYLSSDIPFTDCFGLEITDNSVYIHWIESEDDAFPLCAMNFEDDPSPLYIVPMDPSINSGSENLTLIKSKVHAALASILARGVDNDYFEFTDENVAAEAVSVWDLIGDRDFKKHICDHFVRPLIRDVTKIFAKKGIKIASHHPSKKHFISNITPDDTIQIRRLLNSVEFRRLNPVPGFGDMEDQLGNWP